MNPKLIGIAIVAVLIAGVAYVSLGSSQAPVPAPRVGSITGPVSNYTYSCVGSVCTFSQAAALRQATTTLCAIQSPAATSTLVMPVLRVDNASTSATVWSMYVSATPYATTTQIGTNYSIAASQGAYITGSSTPTAGMRIVSPNQYIVFQGVGGITSGDAVGAGFVPTGTCFAQFVAPQF